MYVSPITNQPSFAAKTSIIASESIITKEAAERFVKLGETIGKPTDSITVTVSDIFKSKVNPSSDVFDVNLKTVFDSQVKEQNITIPVKKFSPEEYVTRILTKLANK